MASAYDLLCIGIENRTLNDEFEGFKVLGRYHTSNSNNVLMNVEVSSHLKMTVDFAPCKVKFDIDIKLVMNDQEKVAENKLFSSK